MTVAIFPNQKYFSGVLLFLFTISGCQQIQFADERLAPLPQDPLIQVYFNHNPAAEYKEFYRQKTRLGDDLEQKIIDTIEQAKQTVDVAHNNAPNICVFRNIVIFL